MHPSPLQLDEERKEGKGGLKILVKSLLERSVVGALILLGGGLLKRFPLFSYLNHSFILSLNVNVCVRFLVFLQISLCFLFVESCVG